MSKPSLASLQQQIIELTEALQRERADVINVRRQHEEQIANLKNLVKANVVRDLLPVIDNFERALKHSPVIPGLTGNPVKKDSSGPPVGAQGDTRKKLNDFIKGVQGVVKQFELTLQQMGVERIKTVGEVFDPRYHEAVAMEDGGGSREIISDELQAGYTLGDDVLRHAMVKVRTQ